MPFLHAVRFLINYADHLFDFGHMLTASPVIINLQDDIDNPLKVHLKSNMSKSVDTGIADTAFYHHCKAHRVQHLSVNQETNQIK